MTKKMFDLSEESFRSLITRCQDGKIRFTMNLTASDRRLECIDGALEDREMMSATPARIHLNPQFPSARQLLNFLERNGQAHPDENDFSPGPDYPERYDGRFELDPPTADENRELALVLVAYSEDEVVGYANIPVEIAFPDEPHGRYQNEAWVVFKPALVQVLRQHRGLGYGYDLSIAAGHLCSDILTIAYRAARPPITIQPYFTAEYHSEGGERFGRQIARQLTRTIDDLRHDERRSSVELMELTVSAGY